MGEQTNLCGTWWNMALYLTSDQTKRLVLQFFSVVANHDFRQDQTSTVRNLAIFPHFSIKLHHAFRYTHFFYPFLSGHKRRKPLKQLSQTAQRFRGMRFFLFVPFHVDPCPCRRPQLGAIKVRRSTTRDASIKNRLIQSLRCVF